ncbi:hypothetical protein C2S53_009222 [Perilla frutescens var. hirtella]|uniref:RING-type domain-containing protein n=1 Tax=Perilla frutescens var. hirtella TaxID=608512 RepID=A0AAD4IQ23_PERFH|nr:hypothetical protein C2S53_009222 [Perilla frutescens var. hirtella]
MRSDSGVVVGEILLKYYGLLLRAMPAMELRVVQENVVDSMTHRHQEDLELMEEEEEDLELIEEDEEEEEDEYYADTVDFPSTRNHEELSEESILNQLKTRIVGVEEEKICCVCQEDLCEGEGRVATLDCNHDYHVHCIIDWLRRGRNLCPLCRAVVVR